MPDSRRETGISRYAGARPNARLAVGPEATCAEGPVVRLGKTDGDPI